MRIGIFGVGAGEAGGNKVDGLISAIATAHEQGFGSFWTAQIFEVDALTTFAVAGREVPDIKLGTAVVPTYPRHPMMLAQQALTVQAAIGDRLQLGIGLSHQPVVEGMWGISFDKPVGHMKDYLTILGGLLHDGQISHGGEHLVSRGGIGVKAEAPPVLVAALGPLMLKVTGRLADGTITWMTGPVTVGEHTVPVINEAADGAGRPQPQVIAAVPVSITDDVDGAKAMAKELFGFYGDLPSYRAMLDREGFVNSWDIALTGSFDEVATGLQRYADAGATTVVASVFGQPDDVTRTISELAGLL